MKRYPSTAGQKKDTPPPYNTSTMEIVSLWDNKTSPEIATSLMSCNYAFKLNKIFPKRYFKSLWLNWMKSCKLSKRESWKEIWHSVHCVLRAVRLGSSPGRWDHSKSLIDCNFAVHQATETYSTRDIQYTMFGNGRNCSKSRSSWLHRFWF